MIDFPTGGNNTLDQIFTNIQDCYKPLIKNPSFAFQTVTISAFPKSRISSKPQNKVNKTRRKRRKAINSLGHFLLAIPLNSILTNFQSCEEFETLNKKTPEGICIRQ